MMDVQTFASFQDALDSTGCSSPDELEDACLSITGTFVDGEPVYFVLDRGTPDEVIHNIAFELREGRAMTEYEQTIRALALARAS